MGKASQGEPSRSDALVFGATGDLAYKKIFPVLQAMARNGRLDLPAVGVAKSRWSLAQLVERARASLVVEKPFGRDLESACALNATIHCALPEDSVFRIDHLLGKEAVQNVDPVIHGPSPMFEHEPGTWGPREADALVADVGGWNTSSLMEDCAAEPRTKTTRWPDTSCPTFQFDPGPPEPHYLGARMGQVRSVMYRRPADGGKHDAAAAAERPPARDCRGSVRAIKLARSGRFSAPRSRSDVPRVRGPRRESEAEIERTRFNR